jgi:diadenosine tetraphosphatase ApaH/serine/threonine PP2A family protein phosphatase
VQDEERQYLRTLPAHIRLEYQLNDENLSVLMVHGSPRKINEYLFEDRDEKSMYRIMETAHTDLLFFGHTHKPYHRVLEYEMDGRKAYRHAINLGSIGKPKDGDPRACYVMLTLDENSDKFNKNSIQVEFMRVAYDVEKAAKAVEESPLPNAFAEMLRMAY